MPSNSVLTKHIDEEVTRNLLEFWTSQLHPDFDQSEDFIKPLKCFVRKAMVVHLRHLFNGNDRHRYIPDVLDLVKCDDMNTITKNIRVPSLCETNIADNVKV